MDRLLFIICILLILVVAYVLWLFAKERAEYIKMLAAKDYTEYQHFENPVRNERHSTMIRRQQEKQRER